MSAEAVLAVGYAAFLLLAAGLLEWLSAHTHRRSLRYRTAGFEYDAGHDHWRCPEGQHLWPHEFDHERRLMRYRAKAHVCNGCPRKDACTDSDDGREIVRALDPWPHSEAGRFHRAVSLLLVALALLIIVVGAIRNHAPAEAAALLVLLVAALAVGRWMARDLRVAPVELPGPGRVPRAARRGGRGGRAPRAQPVGVAEPDAGRRLRWCSSRAPCSSSPRRCVAANVRVLREYERGIVFRLGRLLPVKGPGLLLLRPLVDRMVRVDLRTITLTVPPQELITRDNVPARVAAVCYFRVVDPAAAITQIEAFAPATSQIAQTTLRSVLGGADLDQLLGGREALNAQLQQIIDEQTEPWGIKVSTVEIKDVEIPEAMQRAMARQAEAERERRAKVINAEGEFQAAEKLAGAAAILGREPSALQLRYLQTLLEIGAEQNSTIVFPLPLDVIKPFLESARPAPRDNGQAADPSLTSDASLRRQPVSPVRASTSSASAR